MVRPAAIFADIRETLGVEVVNLIWRHLATIPGALLKMEWSTLHAAVLKVLQSDMRSRCAAA